MKFIIKQFNFTLTILPLEWYLWPFRSDISDSPKDPIWVTEETAEANGNDDWYESKTHVKDGVKYYLIYVNWQYFSTLRILFFKIEWRSTQRSNYVGSLTKEHNWT